MQNKLTISTNGKRIALDIDTQEAADRLFWQIVNSVMPTKMAEQAQR